MFALRDDRRGVAGDAKGQGEDASENPAKMRTGPNAETNVQGENSPKRVSLRLRQCPSLASLYINFCQRT